MTDGDGSDDGRNGDDPVEEPDTPDDTPTDAERQDGDAGTSEDDADGSERQDSGADRADRNGESDRSGTGESEDDEPTDDGTGPEGESAATEAETGDTDDTADGSEKRETDERGPEDETGQADESEQDEGDKQDAEDETDQTGEQGDAGGDPEQDDETEQGESDETPDESDFPSVNTMEGFEPEPIDPPGERIDAMGDEWNQHDPDAGHGSVDDDGEAVDEDGQADEASVPLQTPGEPYRSAAERAEDAGDLPTAEPGSHAPDDEEMPLADHVEEMVRRLGVILVLMAGVSAVVFPFGEHIINVIWYSFLPGAYELCPTTSVIPQEPAAVITATMADAGAGPGVTMAEGASIKPACPRVYQPLATIFARLKVATLAGFVVALPAFVYETYLFMRPGLYPRERRYYLAAVPTSLVLATVGVAFAYLLVLPTIFTYFLYYSEGAAEIAFGLTETFDLMVLMMGFFAAIFQIPLFIMLAIMMGVTSRQWLADRRLLFWAAFAGIAFIFNPDPTGMAPFIVAATMIALFEGTLLLLSWTGSEGLLPSPEAVTARRPYAWVLAGVAGYLASDVPLPESYYDVLPALLRGYIENNNLLGMTPLVVGGLLIGIYELVVFLLRRYLPVGGWRRKLFSGRVSLFRLRSPVWILSLVVGYLASPNPFLLDRARTIGLEPIEAAAVTIGLIVAFEVLLALWKFLRPAEEERLPLER